MTRKEFESLSLNARLWAKLGPEFPNLPCHHSEPDALQYFAPKFDSDDSPRWLLMEAVRVARDAPSATPEALFFFSLQEARSCAAWLQKILPLPEWVTE